MIAIPLRFTSWQMLVEHSTSCVKSRIFIRMLTFWQRDAIRALEAGNNVSAGEIVIAAFPFSSLVGIKRRPCLVLAQADTPNDFVVAFITSNATAARLPSAVLVDSVHVGFKKTA
jgi:hypothetical protein